MFIWKIVVSAIALIVSNVALADSGPWQLPNIRPQKVAVDFTLTFENAFQLSSTSWLNREAEADHPAWEAMRPTKKGVQNFLFETRSFDKVLPATQVAARIAEDGYENADLWQLLAYSPVALTEESITDSEGKVWPYTPLVCALGTQATWQEQVLAPCVEFSRGMRRLVYTFLDFSVESRRREWRDAWHEEPGQQGLHVQFLVVKK